MPVVARIAFSCETCGLELSGVVPIGTGRAFEGPRAVEGVDRVITCPLCLDETAEVDVDVRARAQGGDVRFVEQGAPRPCDTSHVSPAR